MANAYLPYYSGPRGGRQIDPSIAAIPYEPVKQAFEGLARLGGTLAEEALKVEQQTQRIANQGNNSDFELKVAEMNALLQQRIANDPYNYEAHTRWADETAAQIKQLNYHYSDDEHQIRFEGERDAAAERIRINTFAGIQQARIRSAQESFTANLTRMEREGDYAGIDRAIDEATGTLINSDSAANQKSHYRKQQQLVSWNEAAISEPSRVIQAYNNGELDDKLSVSEINSIVGKAKSNLLSSQAFIERLGQRPKSTKGSGAASTGLFTEQEVRWLDVKAATGSFDSVIAEVANTAYQEAISSQAFDPESNEAFVRRAEFKAKWKGYGLGEPEINQLVKMMDEKYHRDTDTWNPKQLSDQLEYNNWLNSPGYSVNLDPRDNQGREGRQVDASGHVFKTYERPEHIEDLDDEDYIKASRENSEQNKRLINERFGSWLGSAGKKAGTVEQRAKWLEIARQVTGKNIPYDPSNDTYIKQQQNKYLRFTQQQQAAKNRIWKDQAQTAAPTISPEQRKLQALEFGIPAIGIDTDPAKPEGLIIPRAMLDQTGLKAGKLMARVTYGKDNKYVELPVVGVSDGDDVKFTSGYCSRRGITRDDQITNSTIRFRARTKDDMRHDDAESIANDLTYGTDDTLLPVDEYGDVLIPPAPPNPY